MTIAWRAIALFIALGLAGSAIGEQLLGAPRVNNAGQIYLPNVPGTGVDGARVTAPGGPVLGRWQADQYIATPNRLEIQGSGSTGDISGMSVTGPGAAIARALQSLLGETWSELFWTARGDGKSASVTASITSGQKVLTVGAATFSASDVGKRIVVGSAGAPAGGSYLTSVAIASPGSGVTIAPAVTVFDDTAQAAGRPDSRSATPVAAMGLASATLTTGGAGCTQSGTQTFTLLGGSVWDDARRYPAQVTGTVSGGALTGTLTISNPGSYWTLTKGSHASSPGTTGIALSGGGCTTLPTMSASWNVPAIVVAGRGWLLQPASTTVSLGGGTATSAPTIGAATYSAISAPLDTTIASVQSPTQVTLAASAGTTLSAAPVTITWGSDDTAAVQAAVNARQRVYIPQPPAGGCYLVDTITVPSDRTIWGNGACMMLAPASLTSMLDLGTSTDIEAYGLRLKGNKGTQPDRLSTSSGIRSSPGSGRIKLHHLDLRDFTRHLVSLDGVKSAWVIDNTGGGTLWGAGALISATTCSSDVDVSNNDFSWTQLAPVHSFLGVTGWRVRGNALYRNGAGSGSLEGGEIADLITAYTDNPCARNYVVTHNTLGMSANHGTHLGGDNVLVANNLVRDYALNGILGARGPNADPALMTGFTAANNTMLNGGSTPGTSWAAIGMRNIDGLAVLGNVADGVPYVVEAAGSGTVNRIGNGLITGNAGRNVGIAGIKRTGTVDPTLSIRDNAGLTDPNAPKYRQCVETANIPVDGIGRKQTSVLHGLAGTPALKDVQLSTIAVGGVSDYVLGATRAVSSDAARVYVDALVSTASASVGGVAKLGVCASIAAP